MGELHREPIEIVLERQRLAAVAQREDGGFELLGARSSAEDSAWRLVEARGRIEAGELGDLLPGEEHRSALASLVRRRVVFEDPGSGSIHALSRLSGSHA